MSVYRLALSNASPAAFVGHGCRLRVQPLSSSPAPVIAAKQPYKVELKAGKRYSWCSCGHSKNQPFCDGTHKQLAPGLSPLRFTVEQDATAWLCGCKQTARPPFCDGTHKLDFVQQAETPSPELL
ncbi:CDGSH iron-sulfur domain-containing protein 3, mitochondrial [Lepisosteus oculatus]|uniref:CDGSH iron-sulfur domain-containing protein 3, mitochondrial n=1 Tax=Lepisosteus oculatus TaxID=7918 RepID=UPI0037219369